jgi:hypothetical protein
MENIKTQVKEIVTFKATTLKELSTEKTAMLDRIYKGVQNMKDSNLFDKTEVQEVENFAYSLFDREFVQKRKNIIKTMRDNFIF